MLYGIVIYDISVPAIIAKPRSELSSATVNVMADIDNLYCHILLIFDIFKKYTLPGGIQ